ncbi:F-box domain containing protein [Trema orientale]|uniref:F-box domain containing protein n=1 Tax=Trema orientale TaxID=63057 RepID=A0A2P5C0Q2_TREOI|nr:F-box domain containing protein [Trema orientale]
MYISPTLNLLDPLLQHVSLLIEALDRISTLPDPLIHHILSFVPAIDVVRMSILSRRWRRVWYSVPALNFCHTDHMDRFHFHSQPEQAFHNFVNKWSTSAIWRNVEELDICVESKYFRNYYSVPETALNAKSLTVLKLDYLILDGSRSISLPSLMSLSLTCVKLDDKALDNLLLGCPALEKFVLTRCYELIDPKIASLTLKFLEINDSKSFRTIEVETLNLESFRYDGNCKDINLSACKAIKSLSLLDIMLDDESLEDLICGFPLLESLALYHCFDVKHIVPGSEEEYAYAMIIGLCESSSVHSSLDLALDDSSLFCHRPYVDVLPGFIYLDKLPNSSPDFYSAGDEDLLDDVSKERVTACFPKLLCTLSDKQPKSWSLAFIPYHPHRAMRQLGFGQHWPHDFNFALLESMIGMPPSIPLAEFLRNPFSIPFPLIRGWWCLCCFYP